MKNLRRSAACGLVLAWILAPGGLVGCAGDDDAGGGATGAADGAGAGGEATDADGMSDQGSRDPGDSGGGMGTGTGTGTQGAAGGDGTVGGGAGEGAADGSGDGSSAVDAGAADAADATNTDAGAVLPDNPDACPATYADTFTAGCTTGQPCVYPEGRCQCSSGCSGAAPDPNDPPPVASWVCEPLVEGCPPLVPEQGADCGDEPRTCTYGSCCIQIASCMAGTWQVGQVMCPP